MAEFPSRPRIAPLEPPFDEESAAAVATRLRDLGEAGLVTHVGEGYRLTDQGESLLDHLLPLDAWATSWAADRHRR